MEFKKNSDKGFIFYTIPSFEYTGLVKHCFTSRLNVDYNGTVNAFDLNPKKINESEQVIRNFKKLSSTLSIPFDSFTLSDQVHGDRVHIVAKADKGKGLSKKSYIENADSLITNEKNIALTTFYADCVPIYILDPLNKAIGLAHAGWKGTVKKIGVKTLNKMTDRFGTNPADCLVAIGPSIGPCCFEVGFEVAEIFIKNFPDSLSHMVKKEKEKYLVDLWSINKKEFVKLGVPDKNIAVSSLCTLCNKEVFFSYRGEHGDTGRMAAVLMLT
jgi:hypothetical protein